MKSCCVSAAGEGDSDEKARAKRDVLRLKFNWLFLVLANVVVAINYICVIPTNHQFIINPTTETLNITDEDIEPGLEQSEIFYSTTYAVLFASFALSAVGAGLLFNRIPTWHLLLVSTLSHTLGYTLYSLANSGWMMILARGLAGLQAGAVRSLTFSYFSLSFEKYTENLRTLGEFDKKRAEKAKGYLFSTANIGNMLGLVIGIVQTSWLVLCGSWSGSTTAAVCPLPWRV